MFVSESDMNSETTKIEERKKTSHKSNQTLNIIVKCANYQSISSPMSININACIWIAHRQWTFVLTMTERDKRRTDGDSVTDGGILTERQKGRWVWRHGRVMRSLVVMSRWVVENAMESDTQLYHTQHTVAPLFNRLYPLKSSTVQICSAWAVTLSFWTINRSFHLLT